MGQEEMIEVSKEEFYSFLEGKELNKIQGFWFHSDFWVDKDNRKVAYMETSSYGSPTIYKILRDDNR